MNKIVIDPHDCSREEYEELREYLNNSCWDFYQLHKSSTNIGTVKGTLDKIIDLAEDSIHAMPKKGDTSSECQRMGLQQAINEFNRMVNGLEENDLINDDDI